MYRASGLIIFLLWFTLQKGGKVSGAGAMTSANQSCHQVCNCSIFGSVTNRLPQSEQLGLCGHSDLMSGHLNFLVLVCHHEHVLPALRFIEPYLRKQTLSIG